MAHGYSGDKEELLTRLRRIEGQVRGLARMIEDDKYCVDILTQISAVTSGLDRVALRMLDDHIRGCVADAISTNDGSEKVEELVGVVERFLKR